MNALSIIALIAKRISPSAGPRDATLRVAAHRHGTRSCDDDDSGLLLMRSGEGNRDVVHDKHPAAGHDFAQNRFFVADSAGEPETRSVEVNCAHRQPGLPASSGKRQSHRVGQARAALSPLHMIGLAAETLSQDSGHVVSDDRRGACLAAVDSEVESGFDVQSVALQ